ncbi:solute carrier family 2, facilitated glucose transporter member 8-like isoform X1 [Rhopalosiphum padi]|uniref:solute carrier family 2, facilitated glucose transporter member 8-like isoform X1 n=2 Tax=Rhopalosiphum padi TaxID=40932 RepID=UPI00298D62B0|nr:solute carrier family 2, facilitated glucose transporter member 8-like isoform X1 [Rhopalosiphum padi]XP_060838728.1 solute carrier family 2, facilitated glucose transporter member 8-like isoform X1 [Rhopalosiphum padi]
MSTLPDGICKQLFACFIVSMPLLMAGTTLGWSSPMMEYTLKGTAPVHLTSDQESWMVTLIDVGNVLLSLPAGIMMDRIGRKLSVYLTVPITLAGWILILTARQPWHLYVARFLHGSAMAISLIVSPSYVGEMASISVRGSLALVVELTYASGLLLSYVVGWLADYETLAIVGAVIPVITGVLMVWIPESPYFLMMIGKSEEAAQSLRKLRNCGNEEFEEELEIVRLSVTEDKCKGKLTDLLHRDRAPLIIVLTLAALQMACGASVMEAYASSVLYGTGLSPNASAVIFGLFIVVACVPFALTVDKYGRRPLFMASCVGTTLCHVCIALLLSQNDGYDESIKAVDGWLLLASVCGAEFFINIGLMPVLSVIQCEYFPSDTRGLANSAVVFTITFTSTIMLKIYQPVTDAYGKRANFIGYAAITFLGGLFCYFWVPETKGKSFLQIQTDFETYAWRNSKTRRRNYERI